jgi:hypothetical protein
VDEHQRRIWDIMIAEVDAYLTDEIPLEGLADNLRGLVAASDLRDVKLEREWWEHFNPIDMELELRTEAWAPAGSASDEHLSEALARFRRWVRQVLTTTSDERS